MSAPADAAGRLRRLLAMLPWLVAEGVVPLAMVAERFAMTKSEVVSLLEMASCCGLPPYTADVLMDLYVSDDMVYAESGRELSRPMRFNASEGFALAASARAILAVPGADGNGPLAQALAKLEDLLGARGRMVIDLDEPGYLEMTRQAVDEHWCLEIDYYSFARDASSLRVVEPERVFARDGHWYLQAWCRQAHAERRFRVDRIHRAALTGERFTPPGPDAVADDGGPDDDFYLGADEAVVVELPPEARWVVESYPIQDCRELQGGRVEVTLAVAGQAWLERLLLRIGPSAAVVAPAELVDVGRLAAQRILKRYE